MVEVLMWSLVCLLPRIDQNQELNFPPEVVGMSPALKMGFELLRPWGVISSVGVHNAEVSRRNNLPPANYLY